MRYRVNGHEIRSENAAKPLDQPSRYLRDWLLALDPVNDALDYGCGKLRYAAYLAARSSRLTLVDSQVQLTRKQTIGGKVTTVAAYAAHHWPGARVISEAAFAKDKRTFDLILCANVLSAIPEAGTRSTVLHRLAHALRKRGGRLLVTTQWRNSYFDAARNLPNATPYLDGWILKTTRGSAYYGILPKEELIALLVAHGFKVENAWTHKGSAYVLGLGTS
jgi:SAM-dependent methyltransferase